MRFLILIPILVLAACSSGPVPPADLRLPDARLLASPKPLAPISEEAKGNAPMVEAYAQCRLAHADEADRRLGLISYVKAQRHVK